MHVRDGPAGLVNNKIDIFGLHFSIILVYVKYNNF